MVDIVKIAVVLLTIVIFTKLKWNIGLIMILCSALVAVFYSMSLPDLWKSIYLTIKDYNTIKLILALTLIRGFELVLRQKGLLSRMMDTLRILLKGSRWVIPVMPALIGMLPSVGGALFSAPMVAETTKELNMSSEKKSFLNYWFRHPWEFVLPLYPGIVLASGITGISLRRLIIANSIYALAMVIVGTLLGLRKIKVINSANSAVNNRDFKSFLPFISLLLFVIVFHIDLLYALIIEMLLLFIFLKFPPAKIYETLRNSVSIEIIGLIFGVLLFKTTLEMSGAVKNLSNFFTTANIPLLPLLFFLPFIVGMLTGFTVGFVGATFPLLLSLIHENTLHYITFAFCSGYCGVLLSPVHLCLVLTRQYFDADLWRVYRRIIPATLTVLASGIVMYLV
jgi:integral membrane protein (TIGR00529 family)